jgi:hypothetical protein
MNKSHQLCEIIDPILKKPGMRDDEWSENTGLAQSEKTEMNILRVSLVLDRP